MLNKEFKLFAERVAEAASASVRWIDIPDYQTLTGLYIDRRNRWGGHSVPRVVFRGCSFQNQRSVATHHRMSRPPDRPSFPRRHSQRDRNRIFGTCPVHTETIWSCPHFQRLYENAAPYQLDTERSIGRCQELARVRCSLWAISAYIVIFARLVRSTFHWARVLSTWIGDQSWRRSTRVHTISSSRADGVSSVVVVQRCDCPFRSSDRLPC